MSKFDMDGYVDVAERIREFYEKYPDGRLVTGTPPHVVEIAGKPYVWYHARAYRTPDDPLPGDGWAAEPVPGPTQFTKDSELMNAETAAWGRAIVALGFETKKIASADEARARRNDGAEKKPKNDPPSTSHFKAPERTETGELADQKQKDRLAALIVVLKSHKQITDEQLHSAAGGKFDIDGLTKIQARDLIGRLERYAENKKLVAA